MSDPGPRQIYTSAARRRGRRWAWIGVSAALVVVLLFAVLTLLIDLGA